MKKKITDIDLIQGIKDGNKKFETLLYDKYKKKLEKFLKKNFPFEKEHDDCVAEILIKIFENINIYDKSLGKFSTWVYVVANHYMYDKGRKSKNQPIRVSLDSGCETLCLSSNNFYADTSNLTVNSTMTSNFTPQSFSQPDLDVENKDALDFISNKIGFKDFHLLSMKYGQGYDYNEMEKEMRVSSNTLSNRVSYVKSKIKKNKGE